MKRIVEFKIAEKYGGVNGLAEKILEFQRKLEEHLNTTHTPIPTSSPLIEEIVLSYNGTFEVEENIYINEEQ